MCEERPGGDEEGARSAGCSTNETGPADLEVEMESWYGYGCCMRLELGLGDAL